MEKKVMGLKEAVVAIGNVDFKIYFTQQQKPSLP